MPFSNEDKILIKHYRIEKGLWKKEFANGGWTLGGLGNLLKNPEGNGRPKTVRTYETLTKHQHVL